TRPACRLRTAAAGADRPDARTSARAAGAEALRRQWGAGPVEWVRTANDPDPTPDARHPALPPRPASPGRAHRRRAAAPLAPGCGDPPRRCAAGAVRAAGPVPAVRVRAEPARRRRARAAALHHSARRAVARLGVAAGEPPLAPVIGRSYNPGIDNPVRRPANHPACRALVVRPG